MNRKNVNGSITVFFCLITLIIISLLFSVIESLRVQTTMVTSKSRLYRGLENEFAGYSKEIFDEYGIMTLWERDDLEETVAGNVFSEKSGNNAGQTGGLIKSFDLLKSDIEQITYCKKNYLTDAGGKYFFNQVNDYEQYELVESGVEGLLKYYDVMRTRDDSGISDEEAVEDYDRNVSSDKTQKDRSKYESAIRDVMSISFDKYENDVREAAKQYFETNSLEKGWNQQEYEGRIKELLKPYKKSLTRIEKAMAECEECIDVSKEVEEKYGKVEGASDDISANLGRLKSIKENIDKIQNINMDDPEKDQVTQYEYVMQPLVQLSEDTRLQWEGIAIYQVTEHDKECNNIFEAAKELIKTEYLSLVMPKNMKLSNNAIIVKNLPSMDIHEEGQDDNDCQSKQGVAGSLKDKALFICYVDKHFAHALRKMKDRTLEYELEYIIGGKDSDKDNLTAAITRIIGIRQIFNNLYLIADGEKMSLISSVAAGASAAVLMPFLEPVITVILLEAWALAESLVDVNMLLKGKEVPIVKGPEQWQTSLSNLLGKLSSQETMGVVHEDEGKGGLLKQNYKLYLMLLMMTESNSTLCYRTMDLIQLNICKNYNDNFRMNKCIQSAEIEAVFSIKPVFITLPFIGKEQGAGGFNTIIKAMYGYM